MKKKLFIVIISCILILFICIAVMSFNRDSQDPSGYPIAENDFDKDYTNILLKTDIFCHDWYGYLLFSDYALIESAFNKDLWQETDGYTYNSLDADIAIYADSSVYKMDDYFFYSDDIALVLETEETNDVARLTFYKMFPGTYPLIEDAILDYHQRQCDRMGSLSDYFTSFFDGNSSISWIAYYDPPKFKRYDEWVDADQMICKLSMDMKEDVLAAFGNVDDWQSISLDSINSYHEEVKDTDCIQMIKDLPEGNTEYIGISNHEKGTYININNHAYFVAPSEVYMNLEDVLQKYQDDWEVSLMIE